MILLMIDGDLLIIMDRDWLIMMAIDWLWLMIILLISDDWLMMMSDAGDHGWRVIDWSWLINGDWFMVIMIDDNWWTGMTVGDDDVCHDLDGVNNNNDINCDWLIGDDHWWLILIIFDGWSWWYWLWPFLSTIPNLHTNCHLTPQWRGGNNFEIITLKLVYQIDILRNSYEIVLWRMPKHQIRDKSTLVQVMAWCHQATSHYLSQCWPSSLSPYGITRPQWVKNMNLKKDHHTGGQRFIPSPKHERCLGITSCKMSWSFSLLYLRPLLPEAGISGRDK